MKEHLSPDQPQRVISAAASMLSDLSQSAGVVMAPKRPTAFRHIEFLSLSDKRVLLILVTPDGDVQNRILFTDQAYTQLQLAEVANFINQHYAGVGFETIRTRIHGELKELREDIVRLTEAAVEVGGQALEESDLCETLGLDLPPLTPALEKLIQAELPDFVGAANPVDLTAQAITHLKMYTKTIEPLLADERDGSLVLQVIVSSASDYALVKGRASLKPLLGAKKPVIYAMLGDEAEVPEKLITESRGGNVPFFRSPERAFRRSPRSRPMAARSKLRQPASGRYR